MCSNQDPNSTDDYIGYKIPLLSRIDVGSFVYKWFEDYEVKRKDKDVATSLLLFLTKYYRTLKHRDLSPITIGIYCKHSETIHIKQFYEEVIRSGPFYDLATACFLQHIDQEEPIDLLGFYMWLAKYKPKGYSCSYILEKEWLPFSMDRSDIDIFSILNKQGIYLRSSKEGRDIYRWSDIRLAKRIANINNYVAHMHRLNTLHKGITSVPLHIYNCLPDRLTKKYDDTCHLL